MWSNFLAHAQTVKVGFTFYFKTIKTRICSCLSFCYLAVSLRESSRWSEGVLRTPLLSDTDPASTALRGLRPPSPPRPGSTVRLDYSSPLSLQNACVHVHAHVCTSAHGTVCVFLDKEGCGRTVKNWQIKAGGRRKGYSPTSPHWAYWPICHRPTRAGNMVAVSYLQISPNLLYKFYKVRKWGPEFTDFVSNLFVLLNPEPLSKTNRVVSILASISHTN